MSQNSPSSGGLLRFQFVWAARPEGCNRTCIASVPYGLPPDEPGGQYPILDVSFISGLTGERPCLAAATPLSSYKCGHSPPVTLPVHIIAVQHVA